MSIAGTEALAGLQLLVAVARADSDLTTDERAVIAEALEEAKLPGGITGRWLIESSSDVDALIAQIESQEARDVALSACLTMANAQRVCPPNQQAILDKIDRAWAVPAETKLLLARALEEAHDTVWLTPLETTAALDRRETLVETETLRCSVLAAALGLDPQPLVSVVTDLVVAGLQTKMFRDIGRYWGIVASVETAKSVLAGLGIGTGARVAVNALVKFVPGVGSVFAARTNFVSTWALGRVADAYWSRSGDDAETTDDVWLRHAFETAKSEGRRLYERHEADIQAKHAAHVVLLEELAREYRAGRITLVDYERRVSELK